MSRTSATSNLLTAAIDSVIAMAIAIGAVVWANSTHIGAGGLTEFLAIRVTLLNASFSIVFTVLWKQCMALVGGYRRDIHLLRQFGLTSSACAAMTVVMGAYLYARQAQGPIRNILAAFLVASILYEGLRLVSIRIAERWQEPDHVVILGTGRRAGKAWRELRLDPRGRRKLLGFFDDRERSEMSPDITARYLGSVDELPEYLLQNVVDELIIAAPLRSCYDLAQRAVSMAEAAGVRVLSLNDFYMLNHDRTLRQRSSPFVELVAKDDAHAVAHGLKRGLDVIIAAVGLVALSPLMLALAVLVRLTSRGPVFFIQERYGYRRRRFRMWKFRSMVQNAPEIMHTLEQQNQASGPIFKIKDDPRVTPIGRILRQTSLDELPQLWNVLIGDMSLVGPRPMSVRDVSRFSESMLMRRFSVQPGITGKWQVQGRSSLSFEQWIELDFQYIDEWSLALDLKILALTVPAVLRRSGAH